MRRLALATLALAGFSQAALAADMPVKAAAPTTALVAAYNWTGLYVGLNGGIVWNRYNWTNTAGITSGDFNGSGSLFGVTLGYNRQVNNIVFGLEGDWDWSGSKATATNAACGGTCQTEARWLSTLRGRLGFAWDRTLLYVTGGVAWAKFTPSTVPAVAGLTDYTQAGWTLGGGVEFAVADRWTVKAEYLYVGLRTSPVFFAPTGVTTTNRMSVARIGLNYRFW
jgi:outer membrane immunogenic protein